MWNEWENGFFCLLKIWCVIENVENVKDIFWILSFKMVCDNKDDKWNVMVLVLDKLSKFKVNIIKFYLLLLGLLL